MRALAATAIVLAATARAEADAPVLDLEQLTARTLASSRARMAHLDVVSADAKADEARAARLPRLSVTAFLAPSPEARCADPSCLTADNEPSPLRLSGAFGGVSLSLTQPLYTFGKLDAAIDAADADARAQRALEDAAAGDLVVEAATAYYGAKLADELVAMLEEGIAEIEDARARLVERLDDGTGEVTIEDRQRLDTLLAEARIQLADARTAAGQASAGVQAIAGEDGALLDDAPLEPIELELHDLGQYVDRAGSRHPSVRAARATAASAARLADGERARHAPDLSLVASFAFTQAQGVEDIPNAIYGDPYHTRTATISLVLRWDVEPLTTVARVARARAAEARADEAAELADTEVTREATAAWTEAATAKDRVAAATDGEAAARTWLASLLQADALGLTETRDLASAYIAWFGMRARLAQAVFRWNVATVKLRRASGDIRATSAQ